MSCIFCTEPTIQSNTIIKNQHAFAFPTNIPIVPGHLLIAPIRHVPTTDELTPQELQSIYDIIQQLKPALRKIFHAEGFNYALNEGQVAGQSVPHVHMHLLPRKTGDTGITEYEPRKFLYRPGSRETSPDAELNAIAELIKKSL